ncbi:pantoate--beta-alanine ligase [Persicimonas caeni]|uniref:Pantothenate synthetase n=1 Tax=Persicimonas caeni TaxID=2292766 RepID=A0A4Y6PXD0_PERCE|nr:pantoate--beta-alanine ligase [Persicimonas caeni]QDG52667.1 pantoate--beta-alanine ligase [Persicimonas caeni]QED33889.1 pantoate--beta-alanine ligase [Persicimonas caeni]
MKVIDSIDELRRARRALEGSVAFVPTMGYLHEGHLELMREANRRADHLVVSIFVNPTQFAPGEDLDAYPRDPQGDQNKCAELGTELLFMPTPDNMYAGDHATTVEVAGLDEVLCGQSRPTHFQGVCTVVSKLFNIVAPDVAIFGEKDYQQLAILRRMTRDLNFPIEIVGVPTVREEDGLAISSRNKYLDGQQRQDARCLSQALAMAWRAYERGERDAEKLVGVAKARLRETVQLDAIDYVECVDPDSLERLNGDKRYIDEQRGAVLAMAVQVGHARLIDNLRLDRPLPDALR